MDLLEEIASWDTYNLTQDQKFRSHLYYQANVNRYCYWYKDDCSHCGNSIVNIHKELIELYKNRNEGKNNKTD